MDLQFSCVEIYVPISKQLPALGIMGWKYTCGKIHPSTMKKSKRQWQNMG
jgi:hypothetical protein